MVQDPSAKPLSRAEFEAMLLDPNVPDSALRPYLRIDALESTGFKPNVVINSDLVLAPEGLEAAVAMASLNGLDRWRRQQRYKAKVQGWTGLKAVDEGDSWFQYPFLLDDVIDHLFDPWAIYSCSAAGDLLKDIARQDEIVSAVLSEKPDILLLSAGGNDVLGGGALQTHLLPFKAGRAPADYVKPSFDDLLASSMALYGDIIEKALSAGAKRVVCHGYDYAIPKKGRWLGRPMAALGIVDNDLQRRIVAELIDRFRAGLVKMAGTFPRHVIAVDTRNSVPVGQWHDELHPTSAGFAFPAKLIRVSGETGKPAQFPSQLPSTESVGGDETLEMAEAPMDGLESGGEEGLAPATAAALRVLLNTDEALLLDEIGRRQELLAIRPEAADGIELEFAARGTAEDLEGFGAMFHDLGLAIVARMERELYGLLCGQDAANAELRDELRASLNLSQPTVVGVLTAGLIAIGCPAFVAPFVATVVVKKGIAPALEETCKLWSVRLGDAPEPVAPDAAAPDAAAQGS
jgi:hypothetical protein